MKTFLINRIAFPGSICLSLLACNETGNTEQQMQDQNAGTATAAIAADTTTGLITTLTDVWVLDSANGKPASAATFAPNGLPYFDLSLETNKVSGYTGCNGVNALLQAEGEKIKFDSVVIDKRPCKNKAFEKKLMDAFQSGKMTYSIVNDRLHLIMGSNTVYIFRKIRR